MYRVFAIILATAAISCSNEAPQPAALAEEPVSAPSREAHTADQEELQGAPRSGPVWFDGAEHLPEGHPCHDEANVFQLVCEDDDCTSAAAWGFSLAHTYEDSEGMKPRAVRGVRWHERGTEQMLVTCNISGEGLLSGQRYKPNWGYRMPIADKLGGRTDPAWIFNDVAQPAADAFDHVVVRWLRRPDSQSAWEIVRAVDRSADLDGYGVTAEVTQLGSMPITARDKDGDGLLETSAMVMWGVEGVPAMLELEVREGDAGCHRVLFLDPKREVLGSVTRGACEASATTSDGETATASLGPFPASAPVNPALQELLTDVEPRAIAAIPNLTDPTQ